jgi:hypothetical protein
MSTITECEIRRLSKHSDYSLGVTIPSNFLRIMDMERGDLLKFGIDLDTTGKKCLILEKTN